MARGPRAHLARWGLSALLLAAACTPKAAVKPTGSRDEGLASYYGEGFDGKLTANGEKFDRKAFTAAHRTAPFGTCFKVTWIETGRSVKVRVNDRGPYAGGRLIDLSEAAAKALGMIEKGVVRVRLGPC